MGNPGSWVVSFINAGKCTFRPDGRQQGHTWRASVGVRMDIRCPCHLISRLFRTDRTTRLSPYGGSGSRAGYALGDGNPDLNVPLILLFLFWRSIAGSVSC